MTFVAVVLIIVSLPAVLLGLDKVTSIRQHRREAPFDRATLALHEQWRAEDAGVKK